MEKERGSARPDLTIAASTKCLVEHLWLVGPADSYVGICKLCYSFTHFFPFKELFQILFTHKISVNSSELLGKGQLS